MQETEDKATETAAEAVEPGPGQEIIKLFRKGSEAVEVVKDSESHRIYLGRGFSDKEPEEEGEGAGEETPAA